MANKNRALHILQYLPAIGITTARKPQRRTLLSCRTVGLMWCVTAAGRTNTPSAPVNIELAELKLLVDAVQAAKFYLLKKEQRADQKGNGACKPAQGKWIKGQPFCGQQGKNQQRCCLLCRRHAPIRLSRRRKGSFANIQNIHRKRKRHISMTA